MDMDMDMDMDMSVHVVIARYREDVSWATRLPYPYTIVDRSEIAPEEPPNRGFEASVYLEYMWKNYDQLADYTIFLHGHRTAWHHPTPIDEKLKEMRLEGGYRNISETNLSLYPHCKDLMPGAPWLQWLEREVLERKIDFQRYRYRPGAIFYAHRDAIQQYPVSFYQNLYEEMMRSPPGEPGSREISRKYEYSWHLLFLRDEEECGG